MQIKKKDLFEWLTTEKTIRYRGELYKARYNGLRYYLQPITGGESIDFYKKGRGVFGLVSNIKN